MGAFHVEIIYQTHQTKSNKMSVSEMRYSINLKYFGSNKSAKFDSQLPNNFKLFSPNKLMNAKKNDGM